MASKPSDGHKVGSRLDPRRLVKSRAFNVVTTLLVLGTIVWAVRNTAPRGTPVSVQATREEPVAVPPAVPTGAVPAEAPAQTAVADKAPAAGDYSKQTWRDEEVANASPGPAPAAASVADPPATAGSKSEPVSLAAPAGAQDVRTGRAEPPASSAETAASTKEPSGKEPTPAAAEPAAVPQAAPAALPSFQDMRPVTGAVPAAEPAAAGPGGLFRDDRPLVVAAGKAASPATGGALFSDARPLAAPSFRDTRPFGAVPTTPRAGEPAPATAAVAAPPPAPAPPAPAAPGGTSTLVALSPSTIRLDAGSCGQPEVATEPLDGGLMRIRVSGGCRTGEAVQISYGGAEMIRRLDAFGALDFSLDCFAGAGSAVELRFADGSRKSLPVLAKDLDRVSKVAVVWRAAVNLDLHVFEYGAAFEAPGHLWARNPGSQGAVRVLAQAERRGHGFLSSADGEQTLGDKVEVYTFFHNDEQASGAIALALDYETRGETPSGATCGTGALAEVDFQVVILPRKGVATRQSGVITRVACGTRIAQEARYNQSALPGLRIRR